MFGYLWVGRYFILKGDKTKQVAAIQGRVHILSEVKAFSNMQTDSKNLKEYMKFSIYYFGGGSGGPPPERFKKIEPTDTLGTYFWHKITLIVIHKLSFESAPLTFRSRTTQNEIHPESYIVCNSG